MSTRAPIERTDLPSGVGADYAADDPHRPLGGYAVLTGTFGALMTGGLLLSHRSGRALPERISASDVLRS